jgi:pantoate--beta-alanine ligase
MKTCHSIESVRRELESESGKSVGLVPTMGYLHEGHLSLVRHSLSENDITVVSIFVNPTQFGPSEDFDRYPRNLEKDTAHLEQMNVDYLFAPAGKEMYPPGHLTSVRVDKLGERLCGISRPRHFEGVTTVVLKLFQIVIPHRAYFGQKDAQQAVIIKKMRDDLNLTIELRVLPTVRDSDGLALSSRNAYLSDLQREAARLLPRALTKAREQVRKGVRDPDTAIRQIRETLEQNGHIRIEYIEAVDLNSLLPVTRIDPNNTLVAAAIRIGKTRLIDNFVLGEI